MPAPTLLLLVVPIAALALWLAFRPTADRLIRKLVVPNTPYARQLSLFKTFLKLRRSGRKLEGLQTIALNRTGISKDIVEAAITTLLESLDPSERVTRLCRIAENESWTGPEIAIDMLARLPISESAVESLCRIISRLIDRSDNDIRLSLSYQAVGAALKLDRDISHPKFVAAFIGVICHAPWSEEFLRPSTSVFRSTSGRDAFATELIKTLQKRAVSLPLVYSRGQGGTLDENRFEYFLTELKADSRYAERASAALARIQENVERRRVGAIPAVLNTALTGEHYKIVEDAVRALETMGEKGVPEARLALAQFQEAPARTLPKYIFGYVDHYADGVTVSEREHIDTQMISTEQLGQRPAA